MMEEVRIYANHVAACAAAPGILVVTAFRFRTRGVEGWQNFYGLCRRNM